MRQISIAVIHCAASPNGRPLGLRDIDRGHAARGFKRYAPWVKTFQPEFRHIGYHWVIGVNGECWPARHPDEAGVHVAGFNKHSLGICMIGTDKFSGAQWNTLRSLIESQRTRYPALTRKGSVVGHRDLSPDTDSDGTVEPHEWLKTCPCFDVASWLARGMQPLPANVM